jgi:hypothetical protein
MIAATATLAFGTEAHAEESDGMTQEFVKNYSGLCMKHVNDLEALRTQLLASQLPKFAPEQARQFLHGREGDAWPVPYQGKMGNIVLALPAGFCSVYMRRANAADIEHAFIGLVGKVPAPLVAEKREDRWADTAANGRTHTISYSWSVPQASRKMTFTLTTASAENAALQVLATSAMTRD